MSDIETLRSELALAREEVERWKYAFAAQSRKLKAVLHIPGVKDELAALQPEEDDVPVYAALQPKKEL